MTTISSTDWSADISLRGISILPGAEPIVIDVEAQSWPLARLELDGYYQCAVPSLSGAVVPLFLVLCASVSSLLLGGGLTARAREFTTRSALGAPRLQLVRQAFLESAGVILGGIIAGSAIGWGPVSLSRTFVPEALLMCSLHPLYIEVHELGVTALPGVAATIAAGLVPAFVGMRVDLSRSLRLAGRRRTGGGPRRAFCSFFRSPSRSWMHTLHFCMAIPHKCMVKANT